MTDELNQLRADILNALQNPQPVKGNLIPPDELNKLLALSQQRKAGVISTYPAGVAEIDVFRAEEQYGEMILSKQPGLWTQEEKAFIQRGVNDWTKNR